MRPTAGSVHVDRRINSEYIACRHQDMAGERACRNVFTLQHLPGPRQDIKAVAIEKIRHRTEHDAVAVVRMDHLVGAGAAVD